MKKILLLLIIAVLLILVGYKSWNARQKVIETYVTTVPVKQRIVLRLDGLGAVAFGASPEQVIATLTPTLGTPTKDTGWVDSNSPYGICPGDKIRGMEWNGLHVLFGDTVQYGTDTFFGFEYVDRAGTDTHNLKTERNITLGASKAEIQAAYPDATFGEWLPGQTGTTFERGPAGTTGKYLGGTIEDNKLFWIGGGVLCGE